MDNSTMPADMPADNSSTPADNSSMPMPADNSTIPAADIITPNDNATLPSDPSALPVDTATNPTSPENNIPATPMPNPDHPNPETPETPEDIDFDNNFPTISVTGASQASAKTDLVKINVQIVTLHVNATQSLEENTKSSSSVSESLTKLEFPTENITTTDFTIAPEYNSTYVDNIYKQIFAGYKVTNSLQISLTDLKMAGTIIDEVSKVQGGQISNVEFSLSDAREQGLQNGLIEGAMKDARNKANISLNAVNYEVKGIKTITVNNVSKAPSPIPYYAAMSLDSSAGGNAPSLYSGKTDISMQATVVFYIGPKAQ